METVSFEVALPVEQAKDALQGIYRDFLNWQRWETPDLPIVECRDLSGPGGVFIFWGDCRRSDLERRYLWMLELTPTPAGARLLLQPMDNLPAAYHTRYRMFTALVEAWAGGFQQEQTKEKHLRTAPAGQPMHEENKWLIEQHLEHARPLHELREEWLERRQAAGRADPANLADSMRRVISDEKKRRKETEGK